VVTGIASHGAIVKGLTRTFAVGDAAAAGALLAAPPAISREVVVEHAQQWLTWTTIAGQLASAYVAARRA
jgi:hypothetical protein